MKYSCSVCGFIYDENAESVAFDQLSEEWHCPVCNAEKSHFAKEG